MINILAQLFVQSNGNIVSDMNGEKVMLNVDKGKYYNLGKIGGEIWEYVKEPCSIQELVGMLTSDYEIDQAECEEQVTSFLKLLLTEGLVQVNDPSI